MGSTVAAFVWRDVVGKRWIRCAVWQAVLSSFVWLLMELVLKLMSRPLHGRDEAAIFVPLLWTGMRFMLFQASQMFFLLGQTFISEPEERDAASFGDLANGLVKFAVRAVVGRFRDESSKSGIPELRNKILTTVDYACFALMCAISGFLALISLLSSVQVSSGLPSSLDIFVRGAAIGLVYAGLQIYHNNLALSFPIIQRGLFYALKMGIPPALIRSFKLALFLLPVGESVSLAVLPSASEVVGASLVEGRGTSFIWRQSLVVTGTFFLVFSWEVGRHIVQVLQTKHHIFAPPLGSAAAEVDSTDLLLMVLEDPETSPLVQYHAVFDLCVVSETNVDTWRRAAFFEETGDSYRRLITACLKRLDNLTFRLSQGLEAQGDTGVDFIKYQMNVPQVGKQNFASQGGYMKSHFRDFQLCAWCARILASLTSCSRFEDRYGVAQLNGCNVDVVSSLLSCLLVIEVYLGRRSGAGGVSFIPNSINWTVPSRGAFMEVGKRQGYPFGKRTVMHKRAYAMADVLRTSLFQIVSVFGDEMVHVGSSGTGYSIAERDWLSRRKPLFGAHEMHLQKLRLFLE